MDFRIMLYVQQLKKTGEFYQKLLDFQVIDKWDSGIMFNAGNGIIELLSAKKPIKIQGCAVSIEVKNVKSLWKKMQNKKSIKIIFPLRKNTWGDTSFSVQDPEGFQLVFFTKD